MASICLGLNVLNVYMIKAYTIALYSCSIALLYFIIVMT